MKRNVILSKQAKADIAFFIRLAKSYELRSRRVQFRDSRHNWGKPTAYGVCTMIDQYWVTSPDQDRCRTANRLQSYFEKVCKPKRAFNLNTWPFYWSLTNFKVRAAACRKVAKYISTHSIEK